MKKILIAVFVLFSFVSVAGYRVPPVVFAKQFLYESDLKNTLIDSFSTQAYCVENLKSSNSNAVNYTLNAIKKGSDITIPIGRFKNTNIEIIKIEYRDDKPNNQKDILVFWKRTGLSEWEINTLGNQTCTDTDLSGCFSLVSSIQYYFANPERPNDSSTDLVDETGCKFLSCRKRSGACWTIQGGF